MKNTLKEKWQKVNKNSQKFARKGKLEIAGNKYSCT